MVQIQQQQKTDPVQSGGSLYDVIMEEIMPALLSANIEKEKPFELKEGETKEEFRERMEEYKIALDACEETMERVGRSGELAAAKERAEQVKKQVEVKEQKRDEEGLAEIEQLIETETNT